MDFRLGSVTKYIVDLDFFDVCFNFKNCVCHANDVAYFYEFYKML
jgi:hypothetical protein